MHLLCLILHLKVPLPERRELICRLQCTSQGPSLCFDVIGFSSIAVIRYKQFLIYE